MQLIEAMDPTNPRWQTSEERTNRSATIWKIIVGAAGASALTAMVVASCLDRDEARRDLEEPAYVETTSATTTTGSSTATTPASTRDTSGGIAPSTTINTTTNTTNNTTTITSAPMETAPPAPTHERSYTPVPVPFERANGDSSTSGTVGTTATTATTAATDIPAIVSEPGPNAGHASHANNDPNNRGSNPESPPMTSGAGRFITEAPYWSSSAWTSDADAGAGPFQTERNTPAR